MRHGRAHDGDGQTLDRDRTRQRLEGDRWRSRTDRRILRDSQNSPETAYAVNLAIEELLSITIIDGYADDEAHRIEVLVRLEEESLVVLLVDDGVAFDPTEAPEPDIEASLVERDGSGLGLLLVNRMMDRVEYLRRDGCNIVTLTKS